MCEMSENLVGIPVAQKQVIVQAIPEVVDPLPPADGFTEPVCNQVHRELFAAGEMPENIVEFPVVQEQVTVQAIPEVVGSLPPVEQFTGLVYNQAHHKQFAAGEMTENLVEFPVVQKQVIVPAVVDSPPLDEEFTGPVYNPIHQEQFPAGEVTENFATKPVVHEQVIVGVRPDPLAEPRHWFIPGLEALCPDDDGAPSLSLPSLADRAAEVVDSSSLHFLAGAALEARRKEGGDAAKTADGSGGRGRGKKRFPRTSPLPRRVSGCRLRSTRPLGYSARCLFRQWLHVHASVFAAALEASPVSVTVIAENWNDYTGGAASDREGEGEREAEGGDGEGAGGGAGGKWVELVDSDTGRTYFWNPQTNATRWSLPGSSSSSSTPKRKKKKRRRKPRPRRRTARTR